jgi:hypothetical protein
MWRSVSFHRSKPIDAQWISEVDECYGTNSTTKDKQQQQRSLTIMGVTGTSTSNPSTPDHDDTKSSEEVLSTGLRRKVSLFQRPSSYRSDSPSLSPMSPTLQQRPFSMSITKLATGSFDDDFTSVNLSSKKKQSPLVSNMSKVAADDDDLDKIDLLIQNPEAKVSDSSNLDEEEDDEEDDGYLSDGYEDIQIDATFTIDDSIADENGEIIMGNFTTETAETTSTADVDETMNLNLRVATVGVTTTDSAKKKRLKSKKKTSFREMHLAMTPILEGIGVPME